MQKYTNLQLYNLVLEHSKKLIPNKGVLVAKSLFGSPSDMDVAFQCINDKERTITLMDIIADTTPNGAIVADLGSGTGILGFAALNAGADFVYSVELSPTLTSFITKIAKELGFQDKIEVCSEDVIYFHPSKKIDYVIAELVHTGLSQEPLVAAIQNIKKYTKENTLYIPQGTISTITLMDTETPLSNPIIYDDVFLPELTRKYLDIPIIIPIIRKGLPSHVNINTTLTYPNGYTTGKFNSLCLESYVYLSNMPRDTDKFYPLVVKPGNEITIRANYNYGGALGFEFIKLD